jgi:hypothetical protein
VLINTIKLPGSTIESFVVVVLVGGWRLGVVFEWLGGDAYGGGVVMASA